MIQAIPCTDTQEYRLRGDRSSDTFNRKKEIKAAGGEYRNKSWYVPAHRIQELLRISVLHWARLHSHCCEKKAREVDQVTLVSEAEIAQGWKQMGCSRCDTYSFCGERVVIIEVMGFSKDGDPTPITPESKQKSCLK